MREIIKITPESRVAKDIKVLYKGIELKSVLSVEVDAEGLFDMFDKELGLKLNKEIEFVIPKERIRENVKKIVTNNILDNNE